MFYFNHPLVVNSLLFSFSALLSIVLFTALRWILPWNLTLLHQRKRPALICRNPLSLRPTENYQQNLQYLYLEILLWAVASLALWQRLYIPLIAILLQCSISRSVVPHMNETSFLHFIACTLLNVCLHGHLLGRSSSGKSHCIEIASRNASLCWTYRLSSSGKTVSHFEAPFSVAISRAFFIEGCSLPWSFFRSCFSSLVSLFKSSSFGNLSILCWTIKSANGVLSSLKEAYSCASSSLTFPIPIPRRRVGRAKMSCRSGDNWHPKIVGSSLSYMHPTTGLDRWSIFGIVLIKWVNLCLYPFTKALYAACGWVTAIVRSFSSSLTQPFTFSLTYLSL